MTVSHMDEMAGRLEALGFAEVFETGDKFVGKIPTPLHGLPAGRGPSRRLQEAHRGIAATRARTKTVRTRRNVVPMWDSTPDAAAAARLRRHLARTGGRAVDRGLRPCRTLLPLRRLPGSARSVGRPREARASATGTSTSRCRLDTARRHGGDGRYGALLELVPVALRLRVDDRRRHPGHAPRLRRGHLGHRPRRGAMVEALEPQGDAGSTPGSSTRATTARWGAITASCPSACSTSRPCVCRSSSVLRRAVVRPAVVDSLVEHLDVPATCARSPAHPTSHSARDARSSTPSADGNPGVP